MSNTVDEIKSRLDIVEVVKEYVQLKQVGPNWKGLSPFTNEKTPSFFVSQDKQLWHCFSSGQGGDMFTFIEKMENVDFPEALRILAFKANVELEQYKPGETSKRNRLIQIHELAEKIFKQNLFSEVGEQAREYIKSRGLTKETVLQWKIGFVPDAWDTILSTAKKKGFGEQEILQSGLVTKNEQGKIYDRFRGRVMFPITDHNGQTVAFTGRLLPDSDSKMGKYVNSPQTDLYDKSSIVFGLYHAKKFIKENDFVVLVEGQMDVISSYQAGIKNVVASSGTALTEKQLDLIGRYTKNIAVAYDQDSAGIKALERSIDLALGLGFSVKVVLLPSGEDPDSLVQKDKQEWVDAVENRVDYIEYFFEKIKNSLDLETVAGKKEAAKIILSVLIRIPDKVEQDVYIQRLARLLSVSVDSLRESLPKKKFHNKPVSKLDNAQGKTLTKQDADKTRLQRIIACVLCDIGIVEDLQNILSPDDLVNSEEKSLYNELILFYNHHIKSEHPQSQDFYSSLADSLLSTNPGVGKLMQSLKLLSDDLRNSGIDIGHEAKIQSTILKRDILQAQISELNRLLEKEPSDADDLLRRINDLTKQLGQLR